MKILMINGSPHTDGNTACALNEMKNVFDDIVNETAHEFQ